ncbi:hypothetical protein H1S01_13060 [Heliobacterium chlorum]|uniref:Membrane protein YkvI n=1 Tax=Heliobacterium chlorum TaxID=2698 RepID=A0ABR7T5S7_HELCL|nr:hypothetical protein [Heliobacterium chlorum]MBC9785437.1 hypothetical protein [Heliobacterium chlorum]
MGFLWQVQVASVYVGAVLGAGFASGQEIMQFFVRYGPAGAGSVVLAGVLFGLLGPAIIYVCRQKGVAQYQDLINLIFGCRLGRVMDVVIASSLFVGIMVMLSGTGALVEQQWGWPSWIGVTGTAVLVTACLWWGLKSLVWVNTILVPLKSVICLAVATAVVVWMPPIDTGSFASFHGTEAIPAMSSLHNPIEATEVSGGGLLPSSPALSAFLYVSFNLTMSLVVLVALAPQVRHRGGYLGAAVGGLSLGFFAYVLTLAMLHYVPAIEGYPVPMLFLAGALHPWTGEIYAFLLWLAMFTAALGSAFGAALRLSKMEKGPHYRKSLLFSIIVVAPFALLPFSELVATLYPFFGYVGLPLIIAIAWVALRELFHTRTKDISI